MSKEAATWSARPTKVEVRECELDGVRVLHFPDDSGRAEATLIFGVGARDETLPTLGTLHALEHAVMTGVRRTPIEIDASVRVSTTQFTAAGSPHLVGSFLTGVCRGLADPPLDRLAHEAHILAAELEGDDSATSPDRIEPEPTTNDPLPAGEAFRPPLLALALAKEARASRVALTATGLAHTYQGRLQQIAWPEVVGVMRTTTAMSSCSPSTDKSSPSGQRCTRTVSDSSMPC